MSTTGTAASATTAGRLSGRLRPGRPDITATFSLLRPVGEDRRRTRRGRRRAVELLADHPRSLLLVKAGDGVRVPPFEAVLVLWRPVGGAVGVEAPRPVLAVAALVVEHGLL